MKYDNKGFKWLRIKNWERYQPGKKLFKKDARLKYVLDWTDKLDNYDFQTLSYFERALFSQICLIAGTRPLRTLPNDPSWLSRETHATRSDIPHVPHALATLISLGHLIPMKDEKFIEEEDEKGSGELIVDSVSPSVPLDKGEESTTTTTVVVLSSQTPEKEAKTAGGDGTIAGYTEDQIIRQAERCKDNPWVKANDSPVARKREGFVRHLMEEVEPPKAMSTAVSANLPRYRRESGQRDILKGDI
jgi:hypothetical protein